MKKLPTVNPAYEVKANLAWLLTSLLFIVEILLLFLITNVSPPQGKEANMVVFAVLALPLIPFFPYLIVRNIKAHAWLCFVLMFYFILVVDDVLDPRYGILAQLELATICLLFISTMLFTRYEQRRLGITITPKDNNP